MQVIPSLYNCRFGRSTTATVKYMLLIFLLTCLYFSASLLTISPSLGKGISVTNALMEEASIVASEVEESAQRRTCRPQHNIGFLKTHKAASSSIQNVFFRYGMKHNLTFAVPERSHCYGHCLENFQADMFHAAPWSVLGANIFAVHTQWNHTEIQKIMPVDTVYVSIVREPAEVFESFYTYMGLQNVFKMTAEEYALLKPVINIVNKKPSAAYNRMVYDFGVSHNDLNNVTIVKDMVLQAEKQFHLVMVVERMEESLVLLADLLCWDLAHVLILKTNFRSTKFRTKMNDTARLYLREKLVPDYLLYHHYLHKFDGLVEEFGRERMAREVKRLRALTQRLVERCGFNTKARVELERGFRPASEQVEGYVFAGSDEDCSQYAIDEISFVNILRKKQKALVDNKDTKAGKGR